MRLRAGRSVEAKTWRPFIAVMILIALGSAVILLVCGFFVWKGASEAVRQDRFLARAAPVEARVIESNVARSTSGKRGGHATYWPRVKYVYRVSGREHESSRIRAVGEGGGADWAEGVVRKYPAGAQVTAHYDPQDPSMAVLDTVHSKGPYLSVAVGGSSAGIVMIIMAVMLQVWRRAAGAAAAAALLAWIVPGVWAAWHYYAHVPGAGGAATMGIVAGYMVLGLLIPGYAGTRIVWWPGKMTRAIRAAVKKSKAAKATS